MLGDIYQDYSGKIKTVKNAIKESETLVNKLEVEEEVEKRFEAEVRLEALKYVMDNLRKDNEFSNDGNYPEIGDPNFSKKIAQKKEFNQYKINNSDWNVDKLEDISSTCSFKDLTQTQKLFKILYLPTLPLKDY